MTDSSKVEELVEERFGPLPRRTPDHEGKRLRFIATMHALIGFMVEHPELPAPWSAGLNIHVADASAVQAFLDKHPDADTVAALHGSDGLPQHATLFRPFDTSEFYTPISVAVRQDPES